jgi:thioredoxin reductase (NADPH)
MLDVAVIGAGPIGLACGIELRRRGIESLLFDRGAVADAVRRFPIDMNFFSTSEMIELGGIPLISRDIRPSRFEALKYYNRLPAVEGLQVERFTEVRTVRKTGANFEIHSTDGRTFVARKAIIATGYYDQPNLLGVEGESLPHVSHYYDEGLKYAQMNVLVLGGQNSACDTALDLYRSGARVALVHRRAELGASVKYWVRPDMENRIRKGEMQAYFQHEIAEIRKKSVILKQLADGSLKEIAADFVFLMSGYHPDVRLLEEAGVTVDPESLVPWFSAESFETNVSGLYLAGSITAGKKTSNIFIENGREHAVAVAEHIRHGW